MAQNRKPGLVGLGLFGMWLVTALSAGVVTMLLYSVYRRFDPSQDAPAIS